MYTQILKDLDSYLGNADLKDQLLILQELKEDVEARIEGVEQQLEDLSHNQ